ncbi:Frataxin, mitochondrial [Fulvia fulva]|uniref:ferroxidase n=1 Tax=Passalora fulva TaxID=5499 RepID=A0A9Q8L8A9_PASFU|nr:Frataxin, mitochondrial [Fulvia fulva]KAK4634418.1 Frataxin, mitochondrial [Fulvia fulva]KAK4638472.1 Frataxin, mitochondrial [Fulvia fulva]UJO12679.1 Frataxin, mitochondrial [Fulvia fulva]WPV09210.1 Frataxin, mitochondrial [Fulvia fulva]WPV24972.1 Frataxin, mitochondrial [Fulvia fulva]
MLKFSVAPVLCGEADVQLQLQSSHLQSTMSAPATSAARNVMRQATRKVSSSLARHARRQQHQPAFRYGSIATMRVSQSRCLSTSPITRAGLMPDAEEPEPPKVEKPETPRPTEPTELSEEEYHEHADAFVGSVHEKAEQIQEGRDDVEVEYSAGVLSITFPPNGTYIINKQPPNKQIWLSSPLSGPKRFDWVLTGESMHQKEGGGSGEWVYLRDGTKFSHLLSKELGILPDHHEEELKQSTDPVE